jgi:AraC-like DNA-binding protein
MVLPESYLQVPILFANQDILKDLEYLVQKSLHQSYGQRSYQQKVAQVISETLFQQKPLGIEAIAGQLALTKRTLQLKLRQENTSFRKLLDEVRCGIAVSCLKGGSDSLCEIALLLGFSEQSAFQHAFKRWTGKTPREYSKQLL